MEEEFEAVFTVTATIRVRSPQGSAIEKAELLAESVDVDSGYDSVYGIIRGGRMDGGLVEFTNVELESVG